MRNRILRPVLPVTALLIVVSGCDPADPTGPPDVTTPRMTHIAGPSGTTKIAFASDRAGNWDVYTMDPDGSNQTQLTFSSATESPTSWSPDGSKVLFHGNPYGDYDIFVVDADGANLTRLTSHPARDVNADWSPDGSRIVFQSFRDGVSRSSQIWVMDVDGSNKVRLTPAQSGVENGWPRWSPDGSKIMFDRGYGASREIYTMNPDGSGLTRLTVNGATDVYATWSPDGSRISFTSDRDGVFRVGEVYAMNADGSGQVRLTGPGQGTYNQIATYSPDGHTIAFRSNRDGRWQVYGMNTDGSGQVNLSNTPSNDANPVWSPVLAAPNTPPTADAGGDITAECLAGGASVVLDGSGSSDPDVGDVLTYSWRLGGSEIATGQTATVSLPLGEHTITLTVDDGNGGSDSDDVVITVEDTTAPELAFALDVTEIWPPNGKMVTVASGVGASDACDAAPALSISVDSDEDENGTGDGNTAPDWAVLDNGDGTFDVQVRAERSGNGAGRTYTIAARAEDASGNSVEVGGEVFVPHDKGKGRKKGR